MGIVHNVIVCIFVYIIFVVVTGAIDMDYYFASLRSVYCFGDKGDSQCKSRCLNVPAICYKGECFCHHSAFDSEDQISDVEDSKTSKDVVLKPEVILNDAAMRPALRHHIAHFCPNLDIARKCIRKCMKDGKPAFCGKDHTCYCGHRYTSHDKAQGLSAKETYKNFQDLYEKYFGPRPSDKDVIVENK